MSRSRSSFEIDGAIASASTLADPTEPKPPAVDRFARARRAAALRDSERKNAVATPFQGIPLVSFGRPAADLEPAAPPVISTPAEVDAAPAPVEATTTGRPAAHAGAARSVSVNAAPAGAPVAEPSLLPPAAPPPPRLPDLSAIVSPIVRCEKIVEWIAEATGATEVFLADAAGLPLAGAVYEAEARLAGSGLVATSVQALALALPGSASPLFEMHIGEGPFFQLIGFQATTAMFLVGLVRATPLSPRQAHAIRLACRHALGPTLETPA